MDMFDDKKCDICSKPATNTARDIREVHPLHGCRRFERCDPDIIKYGCDKHVTESHCIYLNENES